MALLVQFLVVAATILLAAIILHSRSRIRLPPGPRGLPIFGHLLRGQSLLRSPANFQSLARKHGPITMLRMGSLPLVIVSSSKLAHEALIERGSVFSSRPTFFSERQRRLSNQRRNVNSAPYGAYWRTVRRNMVSHVLSPHFVLAFESARQRVVGELMKDLRHRADLASRYAEGRPYRLHCPSYSVDWPLCRADYQPCRTDCTSCRPCASLSCTVPVLQTLRFTVFSLLCYMCFGRWLDEQGVRDVERLLQLIISNAGSGRVGDFVPILKLFRMGSKDSQLEDMMRQRRDLLAPLIESSKALAAKGELDSGSYLSSLLSLQRQERHLGLTDDDLLVLCSEFLTAGADTTANTLEWCLANIVKYPSVQKKVADEIRSVVARGHAVSEKHIDSLVYLKAVVKETLRKHPPGYTTLPHAVTQPCKLGGYDIPLNASLLFNIYAINNDPELWKDPENFKPERFLEGPAAHTDFSASSGELNFMPFGAGRRICPGLGLATLHVHLILARLVQEFEWSRVPGEPEVDLTPKQEFTVVMKRPLVAAIQVRDHILRFM